MFNDLNPKFIKTFVFSYN